MGVTGAGLATLLARIAIALGMVVLLFADRTLADWAAGWWRGLPTRVELWRLVQFGAPVGALHLLEVGAFAFSGLMLGWIGAEALAAHQIAIVCAATTFTFALGLAMAVGIRVGHAWGRGDVPALRRTGFGAMASSALVMGGFAMVFLPATYVEAGTVEIGPWPKSGLLDLGRFPEGTNAFIEEVARDLDACGLVSRAVPDVMRWKYGKLWHNMQNSVHAVVGTRTPAEDLIKQLRDETEAVYTAAGIDWASTSEIYERNRAMRNRATRATTTSAVQRCAIGSPRHTRAACSRRAVRCSGTATEPVTAVRDRARAAATRADPLGRGRISRAPRTALPQRLGIASRARARRRCAAA